MRLEFTYTGEDFTEAHLAAVHDQSAQPAASRTFLNRRVTLIGWVAFVFLAVFLFTLLSRNRAVPAPAPAAPVPATNPVLGWLVPVIPWVLVFGFIWLFVFRQMRAARRAWEREPGMDQPKLLELTDAGVRLSDALASTEWRWSAFTKMVETSNLFLLRRGDGPFVIIPKRAAPASEVDALRVILAERMHEPGAFPVLPPK